MMSVKSIACQLVVIFVLKALSVEGKGRYFAGLGGEKEGTFMTLDKLEAIGLSRDHRIYSHVVIPPWNRPFKPGYCESWEWHTDKKYRDQRLAICHELTEGSHDCDSPTGFCDDKCPYNNGSYPYWRLRNSDQVGPWWTQSTIELYSSADSQKNLVESPMQGYASSYFGPGFYPSNAFDNNPESIWANNGHAMPGTSWIAAEFKYPVSVGSVRLTAEFEHPDRTPAEIYVEGSCEKYFRTFETVWVIENPAKKGDIRRSGEVRRRDGKEDAAKPRFRRF